jgi:dTDP-4-dehydrorhamnose reductase
VYISTNEVFDGTKADPYNEHDAPNPITVYGRSKLKGELRVREAGAPWSIVRTSWLYGPGRDSFPEKIIDAARANGSLRLVTDEVASPTYAVDLASAIVGLVEQKRTGIFHLTNSGSCTRKEWAEEVLKLAGISVPIEPVTREEYGSAYRKPQSSVLANTRAGGLGIALRPWQQALAIHIGAKMLEGARP